mgnify:FL=1
MRLYKKAAAVLLAAAMAVSMMTACGGDGGSTGGNGGNNDGKPGTSEGGEENPGDKGDEGKKDDQKDDSGNKTEGKVDLSNVDFSQLPNLSTQSGRPLAMANSYSTQSAEVRYGDKCTAYMNVTNLKDGSVAYEKSVSLKGNFYVEAKTKNGTTTTLYLDGYVYTLFPQKNVALKYIGNADPGLSSMELVSITNMVYGKQIVDGKEYYAEKMQLNLKDKKGPFVQISTYCYDAQGRLAYSFDESQGSSSKVEYIGDILPTADESLFKIPSGYKIYTEDYNDNGLIIRDENGNDVTKTFYD